MRNAAIYLGWYTLPADGPFLNPDFRFKRGAVACHIHSFSATSVRNEKEGYVAPFVKLGAAGVPGNVWEPYLSYTVNLDIFSDRLLKGYTLVEAHGMAMPGMSWMGVIVGDPLYRPFRGNTKAAKEDQAYARLRQILKMAKATSPETKAVLVEQLQKEAAASNSALLHEAAALYSMGVLKDTDGRIKDSLEKSISLATPPAEKLRLTLLLADYLIQVGKGSAAKSILKSAASTFGGLPEAKAIPALQARL